MEFQKRLWMTNELTAEMHAMQVVSSTLFIRRVSRLWRSWKVWGRTQLLVGPPSDGGKERPNMKMYSWRDGGGQTQKAVKWDGGMQGTFLVFLVSKSVSFSWPRSAGRSRMNTRKMFYRGHLIRATFETSLTGQLNLGPSLVLSLNLRATFGWISVCSKSF